MYAIKPRAALMQQLQRESLSQQQKEAAVIDFISETPYGLDEQFLCELIKYDVPEAFKRICSNSQVKQLITQNLLFHAVKHDQLETFDILMKHLNNVTGHSIDTKLLARLASEVVKCQNMRIFDYLIDCLPTYPPDFWISDSRIIEMSSCFIDAVLCTHDDRFVGILGNNLHRMKAYMELPEVIKVILKCKNEGFLQQFKSLNIPISWEHFYELVEEMMAQPHSEESNYINLLINIFCSLNEEHPQGSYECLECIIRRLKGVETQRHDTSFFRIRSQKNKNSLHELKMKADIRLSLLKRIIETNKDIINDKDLHMIVLAAIDLRSVDFFSYLLNLFGTTRDINNIHWNDTKTIPVLVFLCSSRQHDTVNHLKLFLEYYKTHIDLLKDSVGSRAYIALAQETNTEIARSKLWLLVDSLKKKLQTVDLNYEDGHKATVLSMLLQNENEDIFQLFVAQFPGRINPNAKNKDGETAFMKLCVWSDNVDFIRIILNALHPDLNVVNNEMESVIFLVIRRLLRAYNTCTKKEYESTRAKRRGVGPSTDFEREAKREIETSISILKAICTFGKADIDANIVSQTGDTFAIIAAKQKNGPLPLLYETLKDSYDPNLADAKGHTVLMFAAMNYEPDFIKEYLQHPKLNLTQRNTYEQDIIDIIELETDKLDPRVKKLIEVAYHEQKSAKHKTTDTLEYHIDQLHKIIQSYDIQPSSKDDLSLDLERFVESVQNAIHGRTTVNIGMSQNERRKLQGKRVMLLEELSPTDGLLDHLFADSTLTLDQLEEIRTCQTRRQRVERLLAILPYCGEKAYESFIDALRRTGKSYVADGLDSYNPEASSKSESAVSTAVAPVLSSQETWQVGNAAGGLAIPLQLSPNQRVTLAVTLYNTSQ